MINVTITDITHLVAFWLAFARWSAVLIQIPLFDQSTIPMPVKVLSMVMITFAFFPQVEPALLNQINQVGSDHFWLLTILELSVGLTLGLLIRSIMMTFLSAGNFMTQQMGFSAIRYFDPNFAEQVGPIEKLIQNIILMMVIFSGALIPMFKGIIQSFEHFNYANLVNLMEHPEFMMDYFKSIFNASIVLSSPLVVLGLLINLVMGILSRTVPQLNVIAVSFVITIGLGLIVFIMTSEEFYNVAFDFYIEKLGVWFKLVTR